MRAHQLVQRFGSTINLHPHWHSLVPDGLLAERDGRWQGVALPAPTDEQVRALCATIGRRITDYFEQQWAPGDDDLDDDDGMPAGTVAHAVEVPLPSFASAPADARPPRPRCARVDDFSLDANVAVAAGDRAGLERLFRVNYFCR